MKYIRGRIGFAIFDEGQTHADMARHMSSKPESAGFCTIEVENKEESSTVSVHCWGDSVSLRIQSRGDEDGKYLEEQINGIPY